MPQLDNMTDVGVRSLAVPPTGQVEYMDASFKAGVFACRVSHGGSKTFVIKHKNRRITLGSFPTITLSQARVEAKRLFAEFTLGKLKPQSVTYSVATSLFIEDKRKNRAGSTADAYEGLLKRVGLSGQLTEITPQEVHRKLLRIATEGAYNHHLVALRVFFNWCMKRRYITDNPTLGLSTYNRKARSRILTDDELKSIWWACVRGHNILPITFARIVQTLIFTGLRRGECALLRSDNIHDNLLIVPPHITKNSREHVLPLTPFVSGLLGSTDALLFPGRRLGKNFSGWSKSKKALDDLCGVSRWTLHDIRRTFRTKLAQLKVQPHIAEMLLNHVSSRGVLEQTYDRHLYLEEKCETMLLYETHVKALLGLP